MKAASHGKEKPATNATTSAKSNYNLLFPNKPDTKPPVLPYKNAANKAPANPSPKIGCTIAAAALFALVVDAGALPVEDEEPELDPDVAVPLAVVLPDMLLCADKLALLTVPLVPLTPLVPPVVPAPATAAADEVTMTRVVLTATVPATTVATAG